MPMRRIGVVFTSTSFMPSGLPSLMGVSMTPGNTQLTRMLYRASSRAADFVMPRTAHFVAV